MLHKLFIVTLAFGAIVAEPVQKRTFFSDDVTYDAYPGYELTTKPDISSLINAFCSLIGYKFSGLSIAVTVIEWFVSNFLVIIVGAIGALGFCKITGLCGINYEEYVPIAQLKSYATPENLDTAEKFLMTAMEKYAEKKRSV